MCERKVNLSFNTTYR